MLHCFYKKQRRENNIQNLQNLGKGSGTRTLEYLLKFTAKQAGVTNAKILTQEVYDATDNLVNITHLGSSKITVKPLNTQSKNANLRLRA